MNPVPEVIEIRVAWDRFGFVGTTPQIAGVRSSHTAGPRSAAEDLTQLVFGKSTRVKFISAGHYTATKESAK